MLKHKPIPRLPLRCSGNMCLALSHKPVHGEGPTNARLVLVGEAPGEQEHYRVRPFVGSAGGVLNKILARVGITRSEIYITNAVKCRPPHNRAPTAKEVQTCQPMLLEELARYPSAVIMPMGSTALAALTNTDLSITSVRGTPIESPLLPNYKILPTLHPAFIMRQWIYNAVLACDLDKGMKWARNEIAPPTFEDYKLCLNPANDHDLQTRVLELKNGYSADIETTSLSPYDGVILGIAFCAIPGRPIFFKLPEYRVLVQEILRLPCPKTFQYGAFDVYYLEHHGYPVVNYAYDTKFAQGLICPELPSSLAFLSSLYTMHPYYKTWEGKEIRKATSSIPVQVLARYCAEDADATEIVRRSQVPELEHAGVAGLMNTLVMPLARTCMAIRRRGFKIDLQALKALEDSLQPKIETLAAVFTLQGVNPNSPKQLGEFFAEGLGVYLPKKRGADKGGYITDEAALTQYLQAYPDAPIQVQMLLKYRELNKLYTTYVQGIRKNLVGDRLHTELVIGGTATGRLSSRSPNLQNVPKVVRHLFLPECEHTLVEADYKQMELRVAATLSQDEALLKDLDGGLDIPNALGDALGYSLEETKKKRVLIKSILYGALYGRGARSVAVSFNISVSMANKMINTLFERYPNLNRFLRTVARTAGTEGTYATPFKRRRYFTEGGAVKNQALNFPIQSTAADIALGALIKLEAELPNMVRLTVHDSIVCSIPHPQLSTAIPVLQATLESPVACLGGASFPVSIKVGPNWGEMSAWKPE